MNLQIVKKAVLPSNVICIFIVTVFLFQFASFGHTEQIIYDKTVVNSHPGYLTAWETQGALDKVMMLVVGFDTRNDEHPVDGLTDDYQLLVDLMGPLGWDIIIFDYVNGSIDLKHNADNLAHFIRYLDTQAEPNYHLALVGGSMGGIVARTMFVQEYSALGVDTYVSIDAPHRGAQLSEWLEDITAPKFSYRAGKQMDINSPLYDEHYGWLRVVENDGAFMNAIIDPINTCAIALSNGEKGYWKVDWDDISIHNKWYPVASTISKKGLKSTFITYHSAVYMDNSSTKRKIRVGYTKYRYKNTASRYFDKKIPNPRKTHGAPAYVVGQAIDFVLAHAD